MASRRAPGSLGFSLQKPRRSEICDCGFEAAVRTSWTNENPGRRFHNCRYNEWIDDSLDDRSMSIVLGLLRKLDRIEKECARLRDIERICELQKQTEIKGEIEVESNHISLMRITNFERRSGTKDLVVFTCICIIVFFLWAVFRFLNGIFVIVWVPDRDSLNSLGTCLGLM
ncbi:hypothetical protein M5689_024930 [Euphorbia peplus]|nr:hypothetical protein M5689_024930 [Euphorbia peplus]